MPVGVSRQWRQNWGHMGTQGFADPDVVYSVSMTSSMESSRDALSMRHSEASQQVVVHPGCFHTFPFKCVPILCM